MLWYALHVRSNQEHLVALQLDRAGLESFYPFSIAKSKDGRREIQRKFMPGYVFSKFNLDQKTPVVAIPQVVSILGWGRHAVEIPEYEIEAVRKIVSFSEQVAAMPCDFMSVGDKVRVLYGPLVGLEGYLVYRKNVARMVVSVTMLARSISAEVDAGSLELVEAFHPAAAA